jgi:hypothetical protein
MRANQRRSRPGKLSADLVERLARAFTIALDSSSPVPSRPAKPVKNGRPRRATSRRCPSIPSATRFTLGHSAAKARISSKSKACVMSMRTMSAEMVESFFRNAKRSGTTVSTSISGRQLRYSANPSPNNRTGLTIKMRIGELSNLVEPPIGCFASAKSLPVLPGMSAPKSEPLAGPRYPGCACSRLPAYRANPVSTTLNLSPQPFVRYDFPPSRSRGWPLH